MSGFRDQSMLFRVAAQSFALVVSQACVVGSVNICLISKIARIRPALAARAREYKSVN